MSLLTEVRQNIYSALVLHNRENNSYNISNKFGRVRQWMQFGSVLYVVQEYSADISNTHVLLTHFNMNI